MELQKKDLLKARAIAEESKKDNQAKAKTMSQEFVKSVKNKESMSTHSLTLRHGLGCKELGDFTSIGGQYIIQPSEIVTGISHTDKTDLLALNLHNFEDEVKTMQQL